MPRRPEPTHVYLAKITTQCAKHGPHHLFVGALEDEARAAAAIIARHLTAEGRLVTVDTTSIPIDEARAAGDPWWLDLDDLPF